MALVLLRHWCFQLVFSPQCFSQRFFVKFFLGTSSNSPEVGIVVSAPHFPKVSWALTWPLLGQRGQDLQLAEPSGLSLPFAVTERGIHRNLGLL